MNLFKWKNIPVLLSSTKDSREEDMFYDFELLIDSDTGILKQKNIPPQDILYKYARNSGVGKIWETHYQKFYEFINKTVNLKNKKICEIGSGNGTLANKISKHNKIICYEPNPTFKESENIILFKKFFEKPEEKYDVVITSHTLEHIPNIEFFIQNIYDNLNEGGCTIMSFPNLELGLIRNHINIFNTEHISYFTPITAKNFFNKMGFGDCHVELYLDHSIFIIAYKKQCNYTKISENNLIYIKNLIENYFNNLNDKIKNLNKKIKSISQDEKPLYLFGCHAMTSILLNVLKFKNDKIGIILDNDILKNNNRLYGSNLICKHPNDVPLGYVILNGAAYHNDIKLNLIERGFDVIEWI